MRQRKDAVVVGLGNPLMTDEGIGSYIVQELAARPEFANYVDFVEQGASPMSVIHAIARRQKAVMIDCAYMNQPAGTIRRFTPDEIVNLKVMAPFSLHQGDLLNALELSLKLGEYPDDVIIFGIQPQRVTPGDCLSPALHQRFVDYVEMICAELQAFSSASRQSSRK